MRAGPGPSGFKASVVAVVSFCLVIMPWLQLPLTARADPILEEADRGQRTGANLLLNFNAPTAVNEPPGGPLADDTVNLQELFPGFNDPSQYSALEDMGGDPETLSTQGVATQFDLQSGTGETAEAYQAIEQGSVNPHQSSINIPGELFIDLTRPLLAGTDPLLDTIITGCVGDVTAGDEGTDREVHLEDIWTCTQARVEGFGTCRVERAYALEARGTQRVYEIEGCVGGSGRDINYHSQNGYFPVEVFGTHICMTAEVPPPSDYYASEMFWLGEGGGWLTLSLNTGYCGTFGVDDPSPTDCENGGLWHEHRCRNEEWSLNPNRGPIGSCDGPEPPGWEYTPGVPVDYTGCDADRIAYCTAVREEFIAECGGGSCAQLEGTETITAAGLGPGSPMVSPGQSLFGGSVDVTETGFNPSSFGLAAGDYVVAGHTVGGTGIVNSTIDDGGSYGTNWDYTFTVTLSDSDELYVDATIYEIVSNGFVFDGCTQQDMQMLQAGTCSGTVMCDDYSPCREVDGVTVCEPTHYSSGIAETLSSWNTFTNGIVPMCWAVEAEFGDCVLEVDCIDNDSCVEACEHLPPELQGTCMSDPCWVDAQGDLICLENTVDEMTNSLGQPGWVDDCEEFTVDPSCTLMPDMACIEGMEDDASPWDINQCLARTRFFDCGTTVTIPGVPDPDNVDVTCGAEIRCLGDECSNQQPESNPDFFLAATAATAITEASKDVHCSIAGDPESCVMFEGTDERCQNPRGFTLGVIPNCCRESRKAGRSGGDFVSYMLLARHTYRLAQDPHVAAYLSQSALGSGIQTVVNTPTEWGRSAGRAVVDGFNSALQWAGFSPSSAASSASGIGADTAASSTAFGPIQQYVAQGVNDFLNSIGAGDFAEAIFETVPGEGTVTGWVAGSTAEMIANVVGVIGTIYTVYSITQILGAIFFPCKTEELAFGVQQANRSCHYVGKYCAKRVRIGFIRKCIIDKETYCCFSSPFARILNQQLRLQGLVGDWGTAREPSCDGVTIGDLEAVNWALVDLSEWEAILWEAGLVPDPRNPPLNYVPSDRVPGEATGGSPGLTATELAEEQIGIVMPYFETHREDLETAPLYQPDPALLPWFDDGGP